MNHFSVWFTLTFLEILYIVSKITLNKKVVAATAQWQQSWWQSDSGGGDGQ